MYVFEVFDASVAFFSFVCIFLRDGATTISNTFYD